MEPGGRTGECLEMVAVKAGNYMLVVVDEIDSRIARIECLCSVYFQYYYLVLRHCHLGIFVSLNANRLEPDWLYSADIHSSTSYENI
jgi:hypothetical protein